MYIELSAQIPDITIGRAANAPHYEYMTTFGKRTADLPVDHELWRRAKFCFNTNCHELSINYLRYEYHKA